MGMEQRSAEVSSEGRLFLLLLLLLLLQRGGGDVLVRLELGEAEARALIDLQELLRALADALRFRIGEVLGAKSLFDEPSNSMSHRPSSLAAFDRHLPLPTTSAHTCPRNGRQDC